jgi:capsular exopolysaccharide synthesis family protein
MNMIDATYMQEPPPPPPMESGGLDVRFLIRRLLRGLPIILIFAIAGVAGGYYVMQKLPTRYSSSVSILIDPKRPGSFGADTEFANAYVDNSKVSSVEVLLQSSKLLRVVVDKLHLADNPLYGDEEPSRLAAITSWFTGKKPVLPPDTPEEREAHAVGRLWQMVHPARIGITYVIKLDVTASNGPDAARIAGTLADAYIDDLVDSKLDAARRDAAWLADRMKTQRDDLIKSEVDVASIQHKFGIVGGDSKYDAAVDRQSVTGVNEELIRAEGDVAAAQSRYEQADSLLKNGGNLETLPDVADSPSIQDLRRKQVEASQRLADLSVRYSRDYPAVKQAARDVDALSSLIGREVRRIVSGLKTQYDQAVAHKTALTSEMNRLVGVVNATSNAEGRVELREAERIAEANRVAYEASLNKLRELQQQESRLDVEARIISGPDIPSFPSFPRAIQILPAGGALGLLFGVGLAFVLPLGRPRIETAAQVERGLSLQVLATIPYLSSSRLTHRQRKLTIPEYLTTYPFSAFAETIRLLRFRVRAPAHAGGQVIQLTSAIPGEGKSTIAASLAISAATGHVRTVLIDLDLHHPSASRLLGNESRVGVVDILLGESTSDRAVQAHTSLPIAIISAGSITTLRPGIIESKQLTDLIRKLRQDYDLVIVDTPPVLSLSDSVLISRLVDSTLLVVAWRDTPRNLVDKAVNILRSTGAPLAGVLLNKVNQPDESSYINDKYSYNRDWVQEES